MTVFLPGESHGQRNLAGYSSQGRKESDMTVIEHTHTHTHTHSIAHSQAAEQRDRAMVSPQVNLQNTVQSQQSYLQDEMCNGKPFIGNHFDVKTR